MHIAVGNLKFTEEELNAATNNYAESNKIGEGGFGCVYIRGISDALT